MPVSHRSALPVVFGLVILSPLAIDVYLPSLPEMVAVFGVDEAAMQFTVSLFMMVMGIGQLIAGPLSDHYGRRFSALLGTALYLVGSLLASISADMEGLYLARVLQALGAASCSVTAFAWVRDHFDAHESGKWISYMGGMIGCVPTLAPFLGGILAVLWGWTSSFLFMALVGTLIFIGSLILIEPGKLKEDSVQASSQNNLKANIREILTNRQFLLYSLTGTLTMAGILGYATNAPMVAMNLGGLGEFGFALLFGFVGIVQLLASISAPHIASRIGRRKTIAAGIVLSLLGAVGLVMVPASRPLLYFIPSAVGCIGFNIIFGTASGLTLEHFKYCAGLAASIDGCVRMSGGGLLVALIKMLGFSLFTTAAITFVLLGLPLFWILSDMQKRNSVQPVSSEFQKAA
ncbi:multidrug effflux MFS transporter [Sansalvadorimonas sp. 2012CJ34-2]|uniref:Multidrug effflux MFS transporter n=1 Tax=Parendozoicomonas callyspongiae TaxID=2942213 RepID=A0ABT0PCT0_9GAMM|nr:multidrug effflux MFS transporter [Sansalvadorimonas sp. 2012CJ34-2]MCL6269175.1 multidrug effflux MFS transporter [Sansalvadorimonas sp. 2012CJ34-2]